VKINRQPSTIDRNTAHWGFEARTPTPMGRSHLFGLLSNPILFTPLLTADFKSVEEQSWHINTNLLMGFDLFRAGSFRRVRMLFNYYHGYNPYGQFFYSQKTESFGAGIYFMF
jgi:ribosomal protein L34